MKIPLPKGKYIKKMEINDDHIHVETAKRKKVALLFISLNPNYWPYFKQVMEDCKKNFLPHHKVDYFVWSDMSEDQIQGATVIPTEAIEWPMPTLMRYHLFLNEEEKLKDYDYIFYLDADMRVVDKISDEILGEGLTAAEHPMYSLRPQYIPPYEPNPESTAYIKRPGRVVDDNGKPRFKPYYLAGGFQGGKTTPFIKAMKKMKENIDKDFNKNYTAIWNDESHWNKYVFDYYKGDLIVLGPEYIHPDSLIKEYYEPLWGRKLVPKIITITKPFSLSKKAGSELNQFFGNTTPTNNQSQCPNCNDIFEVPGMKVEKILHCPGSGKAHQMDLRKI